MPAENQAKAKALPADALLKMNLTDAQARATHLFNQANELILTMNRSLWESHIELLQLEAKRAANVFVPPAVDNNPSEMLAAYGQQLHEGSEHLLAHLRRVNDLVRDYSWQVLDIYADGLREATKPVQDAFRTKS